MGKFMMIDNLFPVSFDQDIDELYRLYFELLGDKLIGVFFKNQDLFLSDWFIGDIILKIKGSQVEFYFCDSNKECSRINV